MVSGTTAVCDPSHRSGRRFRWPLAAFVAAASIGVATPGAALAAETTLQVVPVAVGPLTAVTAVFEKSPPPPPPPPASPPRLIPTLALDASVLKLNVRGHGRRRTVLIRLDVSTGATLRAQLMRGHRRLASRSWRLRRGPALLRLEVPAGARAGKCTLRLTISAGRLTKQIDKTVYLRR